VKLSHEFDPWEMTGTTRPRGERGAEADRRIAELVLSEIIEHVGDGTSPVAGGKWKRSLSPEYKARKIAQGGNSYSDMILDGDMLKALKCEPTRRGTVELKISGKQGDKADGHNNFSGASSLPRREFIPKEGQTFKRSIVQKIKEITEEFSE
jgi:hypothetical protein